jgi:uncharacterized membrane protein YoaK (UPF0700 family)
MGALIVQALRWASIASLGYFASDITNNVTSKVPNLKNKDGSTPWWVVLLILAIASLVVSYAFKMLFPRLNK